MALTDTGLRSWKWREPYGGEAERKRLEELRLAGKHPRPKVIWAADGGSRGSGRLVAKNSQGGITFYFQHFDSAKRKRFLNVGPYDSTGKRGLTLQEARDRAADLSRLYRNGTPDLHAHFDAQQEAARLTREHAAAEARRAEEIARQSTLRQLLNTYVAYLEGAGKAKSATDARIAFRLHVIEAAPALAERRAAECSVDDFVGLIGRLVESGRGRAAGKLRSLLRAAYSLAIRAKTDPTVPLSMRAFAIQANPIASISALSQFNRSRDRVLAADEAGAFLRRLDAQPDSPKKDALRLCIELGGQRPQQLLRVRPEHVDLAAGAITLFDSKGARKQPRAHVLPLTKCTTSILRRQLDHRDELIGQRQEGAKEGEAKSAPVFTTDGKRPLRPETVSDLVRDLCASMVKEGEARAPFQMRDLRRTAETLLASLGVSRDVRGQIQSHGLGGVQVRHYDRHDYALEKRAALEKWQRYLERLRREDTAKVVHPQFGAKRRTR